MPEQRDEDAEERGQRASFDRRTGEVHGSGSGTGGSGNPGEDYDRDPKAGSGALPTDGQKIEEQDEGDDRAPGAKG